MIIVDLPLDGSSWAIDTLVDVGHHRLGLDRGLDVGELVTARCLDDAAWLMRVEDIEFGLAETRYLLAVERAAQRLAPRPRRGCPVTTDDTARLLSLLGAARREERRSGQPVLVSIRDADHVAAGAVR